MNEPIGLTRELVRMVNATDEEHRQRVAHMLGVGDTLARHLPAHELPHAVFSAWLAFVVNDAFERHDPFALALDPIAVHVAKELGGRMAIHAGLLLPTERLDISEAEEPR